jgi:elongation factor Ts
VKQVVATAAKDVGAAVEIAGFARLALGEGVDKPSGDDFAAEVAQLAGR